MIPFINKLLSYLMLMLVIGAVAGVATCIGITMRKKKNLEQSAGEAGAKRRDGE